MAGPASPHKTGRRASGTRYTDAQLGRIGALVASPPTPKLVRRLRAQLIALIKATGAGHFGDVRTRLFLEFADEEAKTSPASKRARGRPAKDLPTTLLWALADIYASNSRWRWASNELPHAANSKFIRFCAGALEPFFGLGDVTPSALGKRWARLKQCERDAENEVVAKVP